VPVKIRIETKTNKAKMGGVRQIVLLIILIFPKIFPLATENTAQSACMQKKLCSRTIFKAKSEGSSPQKSFLKQDRKWIHFKNDF